MNPKEGQKTIITSFFNSNSNKELALNMSEIIAKIINRDIEIEKESNH